MSTRLANTQIEDPAAGHSSDVEDAREEGRIAGYQQGYADGQLYERGIWRDTWEAIRDDVIPAGPLYEHGIWRDAWELIRADLIRLGKALVDKDQARTFAARVPPAPPLKRH